MARNFNVGDKVYAWSCERYNKAYITECVIEEVHPDYLYLYAIEDNRSFFRKIPDVLTPDELIDNIKRLDLKL